jgi:hypothetical protein
MDTWPVQGMHDMAAHMMWMLLEEARRKRLTTRYRDILAKAIDRDLQLHDPRLTLEVARSWARQPRKQHDIDQLVSAMRDHASSDPGYLELEVWYDGPFRRAVQARDTARARQHRRQAKGLRKVADIERRPAGLQHRYRYQLNWQGVDHDIESAPAS